VHRAARFAGISDQSFLEINFSDRRMIALRNRAAAISRIEPSEPRVRSERACTAFDVAV
jgi:hypothetical protein